MDNTVLLALIAAFTSTVASICTLIGIIFTNRKVEIVRHATNSLTERLVASAQSDAKQRGHTEGVRDEKARVAAAAEPKPKKPTVR